MPRKRRFTYEDIKSKCKELGFKLLTKEWSEDVEVQCLNCNKVSTKKTLHLCGANGGCKFCAWASNNDAKKPTLGKLKSIFKEGGCTLLLTDHSLYKNCEQRLPYRCECGNESTISVSNFKKGHRCLEVFETTAQPLR